MDSQLPSLSTTVRSFTHPSHTTYSPDNTLPPGITWGSALRPAESSDEFSDAVEYNSDDDAFSDALESQPVSQISNWRSGWASSKPLTTLRSYYDRTKTGISTAASNLFTIPSWISQITTSICNFPSQFRQTSNKNSKTASNISQAPSNPSQSRNSASQDPQHTSKPTSSGLKKPRGPLSRFAHTATTALTFLALAQLACSTLGDTDRRLPTDALASATGSVCGVTASHLSLAGDKLEKGVIWALGRGKSA